MPPPLSVRLSQVDRIPIPFLSHDTAGGYDKRVPENVEHLEELKAVAARLGLEDAVEFRTNVADGEQAVFHASVK